MATYSSTNIVKRSIATKPYLITLDELNQIGQNINLITVNDQLNLTSDDTNIVLKYDVPSSPKLLNYVEPYAINGVNYTLFYTEVNSGFNVGDRVFIINGTYDSNLLIKKDKYKKGVDGYKVLYIDNCKVVLDIDFASNGFLPSNDTTESKDDFDEYIKVYYIKDDKDFIHVNRQVTTRNLNPGFNPNYNVDFKFNKYQNNIIYTERDFSNVNGWGQTTGLSGAPGFFIKNGTQNWTNVTNQFMSGNYQPFTSATVSNDKILILNNSFSHNGQSFIEDSIYTWETVGLTSSWTVNVKHENNNVPIITRSNFRNGIFNGVWNGGVYGSNDKRIEWGSTSALWNSGTLLNTIWLQGIMNSFQSQPTSYVADYDTNGIPYQKSTNPDNDGYGYNFVINSEIRNAVINNGNVSNSILGITSSALNIVQKHLKGELTPAVINANFNDTLINKALFDNCGITNTNIENAIVKNSRVKNSRFFNIKSINTHFKSTLFQNSNYISDNIIKVLNFREYTYSDDGLNINHIVYKFYINKQSYQRFKFKDNFYIKGIKLTNTLPNTIFNLFDKKFKIGPWIEYDDTYNSANNKPQKSGLNYNAFISTPKENQYQYTTSISGGTVTNTITGEDGYGYSIDISIKVPNGSINNYKLSDVIDISNVYILNSDFESGVFENSNWNSGNHINYNNDTNLVGIDENGFYNMSYDFTTNRISVNNALTYTEVENDFYEIGDTVFLNSVDYDTRGEVTGVTIVNSGLSYTSGTYSVTGSSSGYGFEVVLTAESIGGGLSASVIYGGDGWANPYLDYTTTPTVNGNGMTVRVYGSPVDGSLASFTILTPGSGYVVGEQLEIENVGSGGLNAVIKIEEITVGKILTVTPSTKRGLYYNVNDILTIQGGQYNATIIVTNIIGSLTRLPDAYTIVDNSGLLELEEIVKAGTTAILPTLISGGIFKTFNAENRYNYISKTKFYKSKLLNGIFRRGYFSGSLIKNESYDVSDKDFTNKEQLRNLVISDTIFSNNSNILSKAMYMNSSFTNGNDIWDNGILFNSIWNGLVFNNGLVKQTTWLSGTFSNGLFYDSKTFTTPNTLYNKYNVNQFNSYYKSGFVSLTSSNNRYSWQNGTFLNGEFYKSNWENGEFNGGKFYNSNFYGGTINDGIIGDKSLSINDTNIYNGIINYTTVDNANVIADSTTEIPIINNNIQWYDGIFNSGVFGATGGLSLATWYNGVFNSGYFTGNSKWLNGTFNQGKFVSSYGSTSLLSDADLDNRINYSWEGGIFNGGEFGNESFTTNPSWYNGEFNGGYFKGKIWNTGIFIAGDFQGSGKIPAYGITTSYCINADTFTSTFKLDSNNYYGMWRSGYVADVKSKYLKSEIYSDLKRTDSVDKSYPNTSLKDILWVSGTFSHPSAIISNSVWLDGTFENGTFQYSSFNPYVKRGLDTTETFNFSDSCRWVNGTLIDSDFLVSKWDNGSFISGTAIGMIWNNGTANYMNAYNIFWENGVWRNGNWEGSYFKVEEDGKVKDDFSYQILKRGMDWSGTSSTHIWNLFLKDNLSKGNTITSTASEAVSSDMSCSLSELSVTTTDPNNPAGNNGTATITYSGAKGNIHYSINNGNFIYVTASTFTISNLFADIEYLITVTDDISPTCRKTASFQLTAVQCTLNALQIETVNPTNQSATNGQAIITYSGNLGNISYSLNGSAFTPVSTNPFTISNLIGNATYALIVRDDILAGCQQSATIDMGQTSFYFDADYLMITYEFTTGRDLDTRTRIAVPDVGQNTNLLYVGWNKQSVWPNTGTPFETWGGDNQGTGFESVLINLTVFNTLYPTYDGDIVIDARGFWWGETGTTPVNIQAILWKGGTPVKDAPIPPASVGYKWSNPTAISTGTYSSPGIIIDQAPHVGQDAGIRIATFKYNLTTKQGVLDSNDTTTPSV